MPAGFTDKPRDALAEPPDARLETAAVDLLAALGYRRRPRLRLTVPRSSHRARTECDFAASVRLLFQFTNAEIAAQTQQPL